MIQDEIVAYYRVSTQPQGASELGIEAQQQALAEFSEVETGKSANALEKRPRLRLTIDLCKRTGATLLIAKLCRHTPNVHFVSSLTKTRADFLAADMLTRTRR